MYCQSYIFDSDSARYVGSGKLGHIESGDDTGVENQWENEKMQRRHHVMKRLLYFRFHSRNGGRTDRSVDLCEKHQIIVIQTAGTCSS